MDTNRRKSLIDRDRMQSVPSRLVATATVSIFDRIQQFPKAVQLVALAAAFSLLTTAARVRPQVPFEVAEAVMRDKRPDGPRHQFDAMAHHLGTELLVDKEYSL